MAADPSSSLMLEADCAFYAIMQNRRERKRQRTMMDKNCSHLMQLQVNSILVVLSVWTSLKNIDSQQSSTGMIKGHLGNENIDQ